ncbi:cyclodeaminase/cyclohydrolase family protein, partial [Megasphaera massiliensis]
NAWVITDGAIAAMNARAAMRSAFYSVRINLRSIKDEAFVARMIAQIREIEEKAVMVEQNVEYEYRQR